MSPGSAEARSGDAGGVFAFFCPIFAGWGGLGSPLFVPGPALGLGGLKGQETHGWFLTTRVFWHLVSPQCPGSPMGLPGKFQSCMGRGMGRYTGTARFFLRAQCWLLYYMYCITFIYIIYSILCNIV